VCLARVLVETQQQPYALSGLSIHDGESCGGDERVPDDIVARKSDSVFLAYMHQVQWVEEADVRVA
jgi:hypothetical protein